MKIIDKKRIHKLNYEKYKHWCTKLLNLKVLCKTKPLNIYDIYKEQEKLKKKNKSSNTLLDFAFDLMSKLEVNQISYNDFSTTTNEEGIVYATLFNMPITTIYANYYKSEILEK